MSTQPQRFCCSDSPAVSHCYLPSKWCCRCLCSDPLLGATKWMPLMQWIEVGSSCSSLVEGFCQLQCFILSSETVILKSSLVSVLFGWGSFVSSRFIDISLVLTCFARLQWINVDSMSLSQSVSMHTLRAWYRNATGPHERMNDQTACLLVSTLLTNQFWPLQDPKVAREGWNGQNWKQGPLTS